MAQLIAGIFADRNHADMAVDDLKKEKAASDISLIARKGNGDNDEIESRQEKHDVSDGTAAGAVVGGVTGTIAGLLATATSVALPGIGTILISGPLLTLLGAAGGALAGGLVGALVDLGIPEKKAEELQDFVLRGETLVAATVDPEHLDHAEEIFTRHRAHDIVHVEEV